MVNVVCFGIIWMFILDCMLKEYIEVLEKLVLLGWMGELEEIVYVVLYFVSFLVGFMIGEYLFVIGG